MTVVVTVWLVFCLGLVSAELNITCSPEGEYLRYTKLQTCECNETDRNSTLHWERSGGHVLVTGHGNITLDISFNVSDPNATFICRSTRHNSTDNSTREHQPQFAYGPQDITFDITPNDISFDLCPSTPPAPPNISVTCEGHPVNPGPPGYELQIQGTAGNISLNSSHYEPKTGGVWNIRWTTYNRIFPDINVTKSVSITINEPPRMSPNLTIKNSTMLNSSAMLDNFVMFNRSPVVLLEEGMMEVACSVQGGFPEVSNVTVTCGSLFKETANGNSHSSSHPVNWTSTNTTCECTAQHVTGCYVSKSTVYLFVTSPLRWGAHARFQEMTSVEIGGIVHLELSVSGFPLPTVDSAVLRIGDSRLERGRYNVTLKRSGVGNEASVVLEMRPQSREDFNNYTLVMSNQVNQMLEISFRIVEADSSKEELNIALIAGIAAPLGFIVIVIVIISVVLIARRTKDKTDEDDGADLEISSPIAVHRTSLTLSSLVSTQHVVQNEYVPFSADGPVHSVRPKNVDHISVRPRHGDMAGGEDREHQVQQQIADGEDNVPQQRTDGQDQVRRQIADGQAQVRRQIAVVVADEKMKNNKPTANYDNIHIKNLTLQKNSKQGPHVRFNLTGDDPEVGRGTGSGHPVRATGRDNSGQAADSGHAGQVTGSGHTGQNYYNVNMKNTTLNRETEGMKQKPNKDVMADEQTEQGSKAKPPAYLNLPATPFAEDDPPRPMNTKRNVENEADDNVDPCDTSSPDGVMTEDLTESDSKVKTSNYDNVILKPLGEDTPPLPMKTKRNVEPEADGIVNPYDTPRQDDVNTEELTEQDPKVKTADYDNVIVKPLVEDTPPVAMKTKKNVEHGADDIVNPCDTPRPDGDQLLPGPWFGVTTPTPKPLERPAPHTRRSSGYVNVQSDSSAASGVALTASPDRTSDVLNGT